MNKRICDIDGCENKHYGKGYCQQHYMQQRYHGRIRNRTMHDPNKLIDLGDETTEIVLYNRQCKEVAKALVDTNMVPVLRNYKWYLKKDGYVLTDSNNNKSARLHHFVIGHPIKSYETDHINRNPLDNRAENLRLVTSSQNNINRSLGSNNTSGTKGVSFNKEKQKWVTRITYNHQEVHLGYFNDLEDAITARRTAEQKNPGGF